MLPLKRVLSLVLLKQAWFKLSYSGPPIFTKPITFNLDSSCIILGPEKLNFLKVLLGKYLAIPPTSRRLCSDIVYVDFNENSRDKVYLSARYELFSSKGELEPENINSVKNYIIGSNNYNFSGKVDENRVQTLIELFNLSHLTDKWINSLSNGQLRRARLAKALIDQPKLLIIDDLFLGLDPTSCELVSESLQNLKIPVVIGMRDHDNLPEWIDQIKFADKTGISNKKYTRKLSKSAKLLEINQADYIPEVESNRKPNFQSNPVDLEFVNANIQYKKLKIISDLYWKIPASTKWRILGDNGTGKTTLLSIINGDHPQSYKGILKINNRIRKPGDGLSFFDLNNLIGISSPELHSLVPGDKTMKEIIMNGLVKNIGNSNFAYNYQGDSNEWVDHILNKFRLELNKHGETPFNQLSMTLQKLTLFLRSIIKNPLILILDEAFSCMNDIELMKKCHQLVEELNMTVFIIGHLDWELPKFDYVIKLLGDEERNVKFYKVLDKHA